MTPRITLAVAARVVVQLRRDPRTLAIMLVLPVVLEALLAWMFNGVPLVFDRIGPALLAVFPFFVMFLVTSVTTLRERSAGTLEQILFGPGRTADGTLNLIGALRRAMATTGYSDLKEFQRVEVVVSPYQPR